MRLSFISMLFDFQKYPFERLRFNGVFQAVYCYQFLESAEPPIDP